MNIKLHLGAHKTATTHIQEMLLQSTQLLEEKGIKLSTPKDLRKEWLANFLEFIETKDNTLYEKLMNNSCDNWIISEENFSGVSYDFKLYSGIYPFLRDRMQGFREMFKDYHIEIFFSMRSYDTFYRSAYLEVVRNRGYLPFEEFYDAKRFENNSWVSVVKSLVDLFGEEALTLWCYEDFKLLMPKILHLMTSLEDINQIIDSYQIQTTRPSLSSKSIKVLESFYRSGHQEEGKKLIEYLDQKYPFSQDELPFMPFDALKVEQYQKKYAMDILKIKSLFPKINFLGLQ